MDIKLFDLLLELKNNYSDNLLAQTMDCLRDETNVADFYQYEGKARELLNGQRQSFYVELALDFIDDLNNVPEMYFALWEQISYFLSTQQKLDFYKTSLDLSNNSDATDFINGFIELEENASPEIAQFHFNRIEHYVSSYFMGLCYLELGNFENAIKKNEFFLHHLGEVIKNSSTGEIDISQDNDLLLTKWNVYNDLGYLFNRVEDYANAKKSYESGLKIFDLEENFKINSVKLESQEVDDFTIFVNNYLLSLERLGNYSKAIEILNFAIKKSPHDIYYETKKGNFEKKLTSTGFADEIINKLFKTKKPFNIGKFVQTKLIAKEKVLEDLIVEQIKYGFHVFGRPMEIFQDKNIFGRQYYISSVNGILDLLLIDKSDNMLYVVELKRNDAGVEVVEQIEKYIGGLSKELNKEIKGIICLHQPDNLLKELVKSKSNIELYTYHFDFNKED